MKFIHFALLTVSLLVAGNVQATQAKHVHASQAWVRLLPGNLPAGGYVTLTNDSGKPAVLEAARSPRYGRVMLHKSTIDGGMSRMMPVASVTIPGHGELMFAPGGYHLMLMQANQTMMPGQIIPITLSFADGSTLATNFLARPANATGSGGGKKAPPSSH